MFRNKQEKQSADRVSSFDSGTKNTVILGLRTFLPLLIALAAPDVRAAKIPITDLSTTKNNISFVRLPEASDKNLQLNKADILRQLAKVRVLSGQICESRTIFKAIKNKLPLNSEEKSGFIALVQANNLAEEAKIADILNKESLGEGDSEFLLEQIKIIIKLQRDSVIDYSKLIETLQSSFSIIYFVEKLPELRAWIEGAPRQLEICGQLVVELDNMLE